MQRFLLASATSATSRTSTRSIGTQTGPAPVQRTRQTQTEPHLCLDCHTAQLIELLWPGRAGRAAARDDDFYSGYLSPIEEEDEETETETVDAAGAARETSAQTVAASLLDPHGRPLRHALLDTDLLRVVARVSPQSLGGRTAE
jgi:hypothetical protein